MVCLLAALMLVLQTMAVESALAGLKAETGVDETADQPVSGVAESSQEAEAPNIRRLGKHHPPDTSMAGGGVIIGGLVTAIFAAVFCYIRVTKRRSDDAPH